MNESHQIKCALCGAFDSPIREFMECQQCEGAFEADPIGRIQLYKNGKKITHAIEYNPEQIKRDLRTYGISRSEIMKAIGRNNRFEFSRWMNNKEKIPKYIQAALWMYVELVKLNKS